MPTLMYHTQAARLTNIEVLDEEVRDGPLSQRQLARSPRPSRYHTINLLRNERWPSERSKASRAEDDVVIHGNLRSVLPIDHQQAARSSLARYQSSSSRQAERTPSSFYLETMRIIDKVNKHVESIKDSLNLPSKREAESREERLSPRQEDAGSPSRSVRSSSRSSSSSLNSAEQRAMAWKFKQLDSIELPRELDGSSSGLLGRSEGPREQQLEAVEAPASRNGGDGPGGESLQPALSAPAGHQDEDDEGKLLPEQHG